MKIYKPRTVNYNHSIVFIFKLFIYIKIFNKLFFRLCKHQDDIKIYQSNEEQLNKKIVKLKSKLKHIVRRSKQLTEENSIDNHVSALISEMKVKEDTFEVEKNQLKIDNQCLKKKIVIMEKDIDSLNSKVSVLMRLVPIKLLLTSYCFVIMKFCTFR